MTLKYCAPLHRRRRQTVKQTPITTSEWTYTSNCCKLTYCRILPWALRKSGGDIDISRPSGLPDQKLHVPTKTRRFKQPWSSAQSSDGRFWRTLKSFTNALDSCTSRCENELRRMVIEQGAVDDGTKSFPKALITPRAAPRLVSVISFLTPTLTYETYFPRDVGLCRTMFPSMKFFLTSRCKYNEMLRKVQTGVTTFLHLVR